MGMKTPCLGAHSASLKKTLVARTQNLGAPGTQAPVRQQPCPWALEYENDTNNMYMSSDLLSAWILASKIKFKNKVMFSKMGKKFQNQYKITSS